MKNFIEKTIEKVSKTNFIKYLKSFKKMDNVEIYMIDLSIILGIIIAMLSDINYLISTIILVFIVASTCDAIEIISSENNTEDNVKTCENVEVENSGEEDHNV